LIATPSRFCPTATAFTLTAMFDPLTIAALLGIGLVAGVLGGMLGVGGSVIMIPAMVVLFGQATRDPGFNQHLYQAAAMVVNVCVVAPALLRHRKAGAVHADALRLMLPIALVFILLGVAASNLSVFRDADGPLWLGRVLALFLVYVIIVNVRRLLHGRAESQGEPRITFARAAPVGAIMGFAAGLMGIGGGAIAVPLQQMLLRLPLRVCIANSTAIIVITAGIGAAMKHLTLPPESASTDALLLAVALAPTAIVGGHVGGALTHKLPVRVVRIAFVLLMLAAAWKMAGG